MVCSCFWAKNRFETTRVSESYTIIFCTFNDVIITSKNTFLNFLHHQSLSSNNYLKDLGLKYSKALIVMEIWAFKYVSLWLPNSQKRLSHYLSIYHGNLFENGGSRKHVSRYRLDSKFCRRVIWTWTSCGTKFQASNLK